MTGRDRILVAIAAAVSVLLHAGVGYAVMNLPMAFGSGSMFMRGGTSPGAPGAEPMRVFRDSDDLIVEEWSEADDGEAGAPGEAEPLRLSGADLLSELDLSELAGLDGDPSLEEWGDEPGAEAAPGVFSGGDVRPGPSRLVDASDALLRMTEPALSLPRYEGATDELEVEAAEPGRVPARRERRREGGGRLDLSRLRQIEAGERGGGLAAGPGAPGADLLDEDEDLFGGPGPAAGPGSARRGGDRAAGLSGAGAAGGGRGAGGAPGRRRLPDLPGTLILPDEGTGEGGGRTISLDDDFDRTLHILEELPHRRGGVLGLFERDDPDPREPGWFEVRMTPRRSLHRLDAMKKDVVWVIDASGTIPQRWLDQVAPGVSAALETLNEGDRFNIITFRDGIDALSRDGLIDAADVNRDRAEAFMARARSGGGMNANEALARLVKREVPADRVYQIILISDGRSRGGALDARRVIDFVTRENDRAASIYCVGVGEVIDRNLLEFLAYRNKGEVVYPGFRRDVPATIRRLAGRLRYPLVKDATFSVAGVDRRRVYPRLPRDIYQGQALRVYGRYGPDAERVSVRLGGRNGPDALETTFTLDFHDAVPATPVTARYWAFWNLHHLYAEMLTEGETDELRRRIDQLERRYGLETVY